MRYTNRRILYCTLLYLLTTLCLHKVVNKVHITSYILTGKRTCFVTSTALSKLKDISRSPAVTHVHCTETVQDRDVVNLLQTTNRKSRMAYETAAILSTLSDPQGHSLFKHFSNEFLSLQLCASVDKFSTAVAHRAVPL